WGGFESFSDFFSSLFGEPSSGSRRGGIRITMAGSDVEVELPVTLEEALRGGRRRITLPGDRSLDVEIPRGVRDGTVLRLAGQGEPGTSGAPRGDLYLRLRVVPHPRYRMAGDDLEMDLPLWPWQAALGGTVKGDTLDRLVRAGLVEEIAPGSGRFTAAAAARLRRMQRLRADLGVNLVGAAIIVDLVERLERMAGSPKERE